jgi:hypothetical protein
LPFEVYRLDDRTNKNRKGGKMIELKLTDSERIRMLENIKEKLQASEGSYRSQVLGLCDFLKEEFEIKMGTGIGLDYFALLKKKWFMDFTKENACRYGREVGSYFMGYWWEYIPYDFENRIKFLDWMITRIKTGKEGQ